MKMTFKKTSVTLGTAIASMMILSQPAFADCTRHIYNLSLNVWSYGFTQTVDEKLGDNAIIIPNGETATIEYITDGTGPKFLRLEKVTYTDGKKHYTESFAINGCYLQHDGSTGRAVLNDPADGDVKFID